MNREGDPIALHNRSFVRLRGPTSGGGDKLHRPVSPFRLWFSHVGTQKEVSVVSTSGLRIPWPSLKKNYSQYLTIGRRVLDTALFFLSFFSPQMLRILMKSLLVFYTFKISV